MGISEPISQAANIATDNLGVEGCSTAVPTEEETALIAGQGETASQELPVCCWFCNKDFASFQLLR
jgi:hypothetical protein